MATEPIMIAKWSRLPDGFDIVSETTEGKTTHYLERHFDRRRREILFFEGEREYTLRELNLALREEGDEENPALQHLET